MAKLLLLTFWVATYGSQALQLCDLYPLEVDQCLKEAQDHPVELHKAQMACIKKYADKTEPDNKLTKDDERFFGRRVETRFGLGPPPTGFRVRKEIRRLTDEERDRLFSAFKELYKKGILSRFGRLHSIAEARVHHGAAFLPWHRVFITHFEEELRAIDPNLSIPYWDYTLDVYLSKPTDSVVFTPCFFGNGVGTVTSGPFAGFYGGRHTTISRDANRDEACGLFLINRANIENILSYCRFGDITTGRNKTYFGDFNNLEFLHDGPHDWISGDFGTTDLAGFDPIFFFHHAFIDFIWHKFQQKQIHVCGVDPETDYHDDNDAAQPERLGHKYCDPMPGYEHLTSADGLSLKWTSEYYTYEEPPKCPNCGSTFLKCVRNDPQFPYGRCESVLKPACLKGRLPGNYDNYKGTGYNEVMFEGEELSQSIKFITRKPFRGPSGDKRHRDMTIEESNKVLQEQRGLGQASPTVSPLSPMNRLIPPTQGSFDNPSNTVQENSQMAMRETENLLGIVKPPANGPPLGPMSNIIPPAQGSLDIPPNIAPRVMKQLERPLGFDAPFLPFFFPYQMSNSEANANTKQGQKDDTRKSHSHAQHSNSPRIPGLMRKCPKGQNRNQHPHVHHQSAVALLRQASGFTSLTSYTSGLLYFVVALASIVAYLRV